MTSYELCCGESRRIETESKYALTTIILKFMDFLAKLVFNKGFEFDKIFISCSFELKTIQPSITG